MNEKWSISLLTMKAEDVIMKNYVSKNGVSSSFSVDLRKVQSKLVLDDLVRNFVGEDGNPSKKYFDHVHPCICWDADNIHSGDDYFTSKFDNDNYDKRDYYSSTHFLKKQNNDHKVNVISIRTLLEIIESNSHK